MRCYFFTNMYMLGLQAGIQSQHSGQRLCNKYALGFNGDQNINAIAQYKQWAKDHETSIVVNAGYQSNMMRLLRALKNSEEENQVAWADFHEEPEALNGALTSIAVVLEERIYLNARDYGSIIEKYFSLSEEGEIVTSESNSLPIDRNIDVAITDTTYLSYKGSNKTLRIIKRQLTGGDSEILESFNLYEMSIIIFMHRLRLAS